MAENISSLVVKPDASNSSTPDGPKTADLDPSPLSKSARKKAAKAERYAAYKLERRAREKEARKEKRRVRAEKRDAGDLDDEPEEHIPQKKRLKLEFGGRVVIDLGFDDKMTDKVGETNRFSRHTISPGAFL
jgi:tRNA (guanine9-N1)-methyltransferase